METKIIDLVEGNGADYALAASIKAPGQDRRLSSGVMIVRYSASGNLTYVNETYCKYWGVERAKVLGKNFIHIVPLDDLLRITKAVSGLSTFKPVAVIRHHVLLPDGRIRMHMWLHRVLCDDQGELVDYVAIGKDINHLHTQEQICGVERELMRFHDTIYAMLR